MPRSEPDVAAVLRAVRQQLAQVDQKVRFGQVDTIQLIKDAIATAPGLPKVQPELDLLLDALRQKAAELPMQVRFYDVGTVQRIGDGVATLSG
ncbi:MAG: hypothetical protein H5T63_04970, partial [Chloroflexi bacterium]|nr:hypothetical protein [Chloroflexota bacterium]